MARDRGGEYGHIGFCDGLCPLTLAMEASGGLETFSFSRVAASPCPGPPCSSMFILALIDVMDWDRSAPRRLTVPTLPVLSSTPGVLVGRVGVEGHFDVFCCLVAGVLVRG